MTQKERDRLVVLKKAVKKLIKQSQAARELEGSRSFMPVVLPLDIDNPVATLKAVSKRVTIMKNARVADMIAAVGACLGIPPPAVQAALWRVIPEFLLPLPLCKIVCTNVPGSGDALYSVGRRMIAYLSPGADRI